MRIERTYDYDLAKAILAHPSVYAWMVSDGAPAPQDVQIDVSGFTYYLLVKTDDGELLGMFIVVPYRNTSVTWEVHTCLLPCCRGANAVLAYHAGVQWLKDHTICKKVIGNICEDNKPALFMALRAGNEIIGVNKASIMKGGKLLDQTIVGMSI
jgi:hypothetical protein